LLDIFRLDDYNRLKKFLQPQDIILEVGALDSPFTNYFPNKTIAVDIPPKGRFGFSQKALKEFKSRKNLTPVMASGEALPFKKEVFNKIICTEVIEHIYNDQTAISEMSRVLKPNGKAFLTTPNQDELPVEQGISEHFRHYTQKSLHNLCSNSFKKVM